MAPKNTQLAKEKAQKDIEAYLSKILQIAERFDIDKKEILDVFELMYRGNENEGCD